VEIDRNKNVGITNMLKNYNTMSSERSVIARNAGWELWNPPNEYFNFCVPLNMLLGFCENYRRILINARYELILIRSRNDNNCLIGDSMWELILFKVQWRMPHVLLKETIDVACFGKRAVPQHGFSLVGSIRVSAITLHNQTSVDIKTATQLEKPRYVIFALQTGRKTVMPEDTPI